VGGFMVRQSLCVAQDGFFADLGRSLHLGPAQPIFPRKGAQSPQEVFPLRSEGKKRRFEVQLKVVGLPDPARAGKRSGRWVSMRFRRLAGWWRCD
jgi:hypothetical protein